MSVIIAPQKASATEATLAASIGHDHVPDECSRAIGTTAALAASLSSQAIRQRAYWETTKRVLAQAVNEGLAIGTVQRSRLCLRPPKPEALVEYNGAWVQCGIRDDAYVEMDGDRVIGFLRAEDLTTPVLVHGKLSDVSEEFDPGVLCRLICSWQPELAHNGGGEKLIDEVNNAAENQGKLSHLLHDFGS